MKSNAAKKAIGVLKEWSIVLALILVWAVLSFLSPHFLQWSNISNIFLQSSHIMMCAIGMTFILIGGQMDLSIGSVEALSGTICALTLVNLGLPFIPGVILACCAGVLCGLVSGLLVSRFKFPPFIATLSMQGIARGIETAMAAGIPVFCLDNNCTGTEIVSFIGTDNVLGGYLMGKYINEVMGGEGEMAVIEGPAGNFNSNIRRQGMDQAFEEIGSKVEVVASISANWKRDQGLTVANDIITSTPDLKLIFCLNDEMAFGAMQAIEASGRDIMLVAYNGVPEAFMNIYNGNMLATVAQYPETFATTYIDCAIALVRDGVQPEATYAIPAAVVDYDLIHDVVDNNKAPTNEEESILYNKLKTYYQG